MRAFFLWDKRVLKRFNYLLFLQLIPLFVISSTLVKEIHPYLFKKQMVYYFIAFVIFGIAFVIPWRRIIWWFSSLFYIVNLWLLVLVEVVGKSILGAKRWIAIPGTHLTIQPSEFTKVAVFLFLGYLMARKPPDERGYGLFDFIKLSMVIIVPFLLIAKEPDLGTALVLLIAGFGILFLVGVNWKIWVTLFVVVALSAPLLYQYGLKPYQKKRIKDAIAHPSYQVRQALIAIGNGGMEGKKKDAATQTQLKFLPVSSTDFIFAYLGERFGFKGMVTVISLYILLILHLLYIASRHKDDRLTQTMAAGLAFLFFVYMGVNIFMVIGLAPVVGLPLPMFSHGGTSFIIFAFMLGILEHLIAFKEIDVYTSQDKKVALSPTTSDN